MSALTDPAEVEIEDLFEDILGKAARGLQRGPAELAATSGIESGTVRQLFDGVYREPDAPALHQLAELLNLHGPSLEVSARCGWRPEAHSVEGLFLCNTPYRSMRVNAFLVWDPASRQAAAFDSGADAEPLLAELRRRDLELIHLFITHTHPDHVADLGKLQTAWPDATLRSSREEPCDGAETFAEGETFSLGALEIETRLTTGHSIGGTTYVVTGLERPVAVVGDALFAGSQGGGMISYTDALENNRTKILSPLPENTVICPGHGPPTTVGEERAHNPFFPEYKDVSG